MRFTRRRELYFRVDSTHHIDPFFFVFVLWHVCCCCLSAFSSTTARCTCVAFWTTTGSTWSGRPGSHATTRRAAAPSSGAGKSAGSSAKSSPKRRAKVPVCRSPKRRAKEYSKVTVGVVCGLVFCQCTRGICWSSIMAFVFAGRALCSSCLCAKITEVGTLAA